MEGEPRYLPIEQIMVLYVFGSLDTNSAMYNFLGQQQIPVHFFDYYEHYTGSFMPREYLQAGKMQVAQTQHYLNKKDRLVLAKAFVEGAAFNMRKNLAYYNRRDRDLDAQMEAIDQYVTAIPEAADIPALMGLEGNIRQTYYTGFDDIIRDFEMGNRTKQPPGNEVNALVSLGNMLCYTACMDAIYHSQLNPTISFLHEPGVRRFSLALDVAEIFKPLLVDRLVFTVLNKKILQASDFERDLNRCLLKPNARKAFSQAWDERLKETIQHRALGRSVSYRHLIQLECYKLARHCMRVEGYKPFKTWW